MKTNNILIKIKTQRVKSNVVNILVHNLFSLAAGTEKPKRTECGYVQAKSSN